MKIIHIQSKMSLEMKVEVIDKETILPSSPTPHPFPTHNLSYLDHVAPNVYVRLLLFYPNNNTIDQKVNRVDHQYHSLITERSKFLKTCLSETLSRFYPFAGIIVNHSNVPSILCNDHGAAFVQTRVNCPASKALRKFHNETLSQLFPTVEGLTFESTGYLLLVQANFFECGGLAIGVSLSHKIADGFTFGTFIRSWAAMSLGSHVKALPAVEFGVPANSVNLPEPNITNSSNTPLSINFVYESCAIRRFVFDASKIVSLKSIAASTTVPNPTRVEVVSALIWKCAMMEASKSNLGPTRPSVLSHVVNMRRLWRQTNLMGNCLGLFGAKTYEGEVNLQGLVAVLRKGLEEFRAEHAHGFRHFKELWNQHGIGFSDMYKFTSWCSFGFYETNFGWGKPSWVSTPGAQVKNSIMLLDTRDGEGIEAILMFKEEDMSAIETNKEMLAYASLNPNII